jgi:hypothetical protein
VAHADKMAQDARRHVVELRWSMRHILTPPFTNVFSLTSRRAVELTDALNLEAERTEEVIKRWMGDLKRVGEVCQRVYVWLCVCLPVSVSVSVSVSVCVCVCVCVIYTYIGVQEGGADGAAIAEFISFSYFFVCRCARGWGRRCSP